ncbi:MAG: hypothetical protein O7F74_02970 [Bacteroidetes bacterium]|nr:hypothetical protein [Bacteroidota bacterium]
MKPPKFNHLIKAWGSINVLLSVYLLISLSEKVEKIAIYIFLNIAGFNLSRFLSVLSIILFFVVFVFKENIHRQLLSLKDDFEKIKHIAVSETELIYSFNKFDWTMTGIALIVGTYVVLMSFTDVSAYRRLIREDGRIEYFSAILWFLTAIISLTSFLLKRGAHKIKKYIYLLLILFFVVCGGEEISWGQRLLGFQVPDAVLAINKQKEMNFHNIGSISFFSNGFFFLSVIFFLLLPFLVKKHTGLRRYMRYYDLPILSPSITHVFVIGLVVWLVIGVRFGTLGFHPFSLWGYYTQMDDEIFELFAAYSFFAYSVLELECRFKRKGMLDSD